MQTTKPGNIKQFFARLTLAAIILLIAYLILGDEDHALLNSLRGAMKAILRAV